MRVKKTSNSPTSITLSVTVSEADLSPVKQQAVKKLGKDLKLSGFRPGKAPQALVEKNLDSSTLQTEVIEEAIGQTYSQVLDEQRLRPVVRPEVTIKKFVPFTELEYEATIDVVGDITLGDYKKIKVSPEKVTISAKDIEEVMEQLSTRAAVKKDVKRAAKNGDQVTIDFKGVDAKGKPVNGAEGKEYPLILGSDSFIPGFEKNLIGLKAGEDKTFTIPFPKDYSVKALANKKVTFTVTVKSVQEIVPPTLDDAFAAQAGPFKTLQELKDDIKVQLKAEREQRAQRNTEQQIIEELTQKSQVAIPEVLVTEQVEAMLREHRQNLTYRGQTYEEFLEAKGQTDEEYRKTLRPQAEERVKAGLVLSQVAEAEKLQISPDELQVRIQLLKGQYQDAAMQAELDKPENQREIVIRLLTEKTLEKLLGYATK